VSWLFSQALGEAFSAASYSAGEPFAPLNLMPTAHPFSRRGKTTDALSLSPSGPTCAVLTESRGQALLTWCREAFHAPTSVQQERAPASTGNRPSSGGTWPASWVKFDPDTCSWRTAQCSLLADSAPFSGTWPRWGSMRAGECLEQPRQDFPIVATECGSLLPTPSGVNGGKNNTMGRVDEWGGSSNPLRGTVIGSMCLPEFEEMVMGWPIGWTAPTPYAMDKFQSWQQQHGDC
jgi:hypothetical protein